MLILFCTPSLVLCSKWKMRRFPQALGFESLDTLFRVNKRGPRFTALEGDGGDKRLVQLELVCEAGGVAPPDPVNLAIAAAAEAILTRISAEQVPSLHRAAPPCWKSATKRALYKCKLILLQCRRNWSRSSKHSARMVGCNITKTLLFGLSHETFSFFRSYKCWVLIYSPTKSILSRLSHEILLPVSVYKHRTPSSRR